MGRQCPFGFATVVLADVPVVDERLCFALPNGFATVGIKSASILLIGAILSKL